MRRPSDDWIDVFVAVGCVVVASLGFASSIWLYIHGRQNLMALMAFATLIVGGAAMVLCAHHLSRQRK